MNPIIKNYIDKGIEFISRHKEYLMYETDVRPEMTADFDFDLLAGRPIKVELEQQDATGELLDIIKPSSKIWKPIDGTVTTAEIANIEKVFDIVLPDSYKEYLSYKHFYTIFLNADMRLYPKPIGEWSDIIIENNEEMKEFLLDNGYFAIGDFSDYGTVCFDLNDDAEEPRIVMVDHETKEAEYLSNNFIDLLKSALDMPEPVIKELKPWQKKMYKME